MLTIWVLYLVFCHFWRIAAFVDGRLHGLCRGSTSMRAKKVAALSSLHKLLSNPGWVPLGGDHVPQCREQAKAGHLRRQSHVTH